MEDARHHGGCSWRMLDIMEDARHMFNEDAI